jgi:hypothetical protein
MAGFLGMRGTGDWVTDQRPKSWREGILYLYPNGQAPLTAIMSKLKNEQVNDPQYYWWTKTLPTQRATITGVYTNAGLSAAYTSGGVAGDIIYLKMSASENEHFRIGHQVLMRDASDYTNDHVGKVVAKANNGASSYISVKLLEADDNGTATTIANADVVMITGNINSEGAAMPGAIAYDPTKLYNYTQIFRTPLSITRTARKTKLRTGDAYKEAKREALELHSIEMEKAYIFGIPTEGTGDNGKPERTTGGIINFIKANAPTNVDDYTKNATYTGKAWLDDGGGEAWLNNYLEVMFRYGRQEKLCLCGSGALLGLNRLAASGGHYEITPQTKAYGMTFNQWITPFGTIYLKTHPLFSMEATLRNSILIIEPEELSYRYIDDTQFFGEGDAKQSSQGNNANRIDGTNEEYLTEAGLELHHPLVFGFLNGFGQDA